MRSAASHVPREEHTEIDGQFLQGSQKSEQPKQIQQHRTDKTVRNVQPISFNDLARFAFPDKTDKHLSFHTGYDERTCRRWRAGHTDAPDEAMAVLISEIMRRFLSR